ncbi:hypothetical protein D3C81_1924290 [compost metagenome]
MDKLVWALRVDDRPVAVAVSVGEVAHIVRRVIHQNGIGRIRVEAVDTVELPGLFAECCAIKQLVALVTFGHRRR